VENDVTLGAQNLTQLNRSADDLPGLEKSLTALSTQETGASQDTALILHGGGGIPGTLSGWGLFGQDLTDMEYLLSAYYSTWGGEATNGSFDGDQKYSFGGEFKLTPTDKTTLRLSLYTNQVDATLPYQNAIEETHQGLSLNADLGYKWSNVWRTEIIFDGKNTNLNYWNQTAMSNQAQEFNEKIKLIGEEIDPFWNAFTLEIGDEQASSNFTATTNNAYNLAWASAQTRFVFLENLDLTASLEGQSGNDSTLTSKLFPAVNLRWRFLEDTQLTVYWKTARTQESFYDTFMNREHISPSFGLPTATENTGEWGAMLTQKLNEAMVLNVTASTASYQNYQQWTDIDSASPDFIETYSPVPLVQLNRVNADFEWKLDQVWKTNLTYQWTQGINNSGDNLNLTFLPQNQGFISITHTDDQWETTLALVMVSDRQGLASATLDLPAYATLNLSAAYHITRGFSLWLNGDNLLGSSYDLEPGYLEPQYHLRGGIE
ncbi:MAG TPA: TonB-dependent receptor, partial [bacterium]|nr:TonB-dependent receptor [bacterium]